MKKLLLIALTLCLVTPCVFAEDLVKVKVDTNDFQFKEDDVNKQATVKSIGNTNNTENKVELNTYMKKLNTVVMGKWAPSLYGSFGDVKTLLITFNIKKSGEIYDITVKQSSGNEKLDSSAIEAIKKVSPFLPLPSQYSEDFASGELSFDYKMKYRNKYKGREKYYSVY